MTRFASAVAPGQIVTRDFELAGATPSGEPLKMATFVVSSERQGNAEAIMEQRNSIQPGAHHQRRLF